MRAGGELIGELAPNQFFRRSHQLPVAITFDPELQLTHSLRLCEALVVLFTIVTHAKHGLEDWRLKWVTKVKNNGKLLVLGYSMARKKSRVSIELGVQGSESTPSSRFHKLPRIESSRLIPEPIRFHTEDQSSAYGNSEPSGVVSVVGSLFPRGTKANVAAYGSGREAFCHRPGYQPRFSH
ncbi:hypothetical protein PIB30_072768 [Stylosanthes scabra]|uniref:Uncharacterized protein n=1 Tax=Stylosanthes scabra TaxID=79078 RepID=A0ABU6VMT2_9FABA|nr:hypothetical protein [Stylosanthes scabra]